MQSCSCLISSYVFLTVVEAFYIFICCIDHNKYETQRRDRLQGISLISEETLSSWPCKDSLQTSNLKNMLQMSSRVCQARTIGHQFSIPSPLGPRGGAGQPWAMAGGLETMSSVSGSKVPEELRCPGDPNGVLGNWNRIKTFQRGGGISTPF